MSLKAAMTKMMESYAEAANDKGIGDLVEWMTERGVKRNGETALAMHMLGVALGSLYDNGMRSDSAGVVAAVLVAQIEHVLAGKAAS